MDYKQIAAERIVRAIAKLQDAKGNPSQADFARRAGLTPSQFGNYCQGTRYPSARELLAISRVLGEPAAYLAGLESDPGLVEIMRVYQHVDSRGREAMVSEARYQLAKLQGVTIPPDLTPSFLGQDEPTPGSRQTTITSGKKGRAKK